jgi:integrative and conjugative element protein (TIGR02256 family)
MSFLRQDPVIPRHVFVRSEVLRQIGVFCRIQPDVETGGPMVGYGSVDEALVVAAVSDPGPRGICHCHSVTIDGAHATEFCRQQQLGSMGQLRFLGDWHVHMSKSVVPSRQDYRALKLLPRYNDYGYPTVSLIFNSSLSVMRCYFVRRWRLGELSCSIL